jgi:hypothetical protein
MEYYNIITEIVTKIREKYTITLEILSQLELGDNYFLPIFEKEELLKIDIHEPSVTPPRIIAFGDIHGDLQALVGVLYASGLINDNGDWIEERSTYLVQTGDLFDNYRPEIKNSCLNNPENLFDEFIILNYLTHLHRQAQQMEEKSCVVLCIGNHEFMNITGDIDRMTKYVIPGSPLSLAARKALFETGGIFATKLSSIFRVIAKIGNNLFVHGGIHERTITSFDDIRTYNINLYEWLNDKSKPLSSNIYSGDTSYLSITWYREMIDIKEESYIRFLNRLGEEIRVIVGHTVTSKGDNPSILLRGRGRIILLDTAMSRCWNNKNRKSCDLSNNLYNISFIVIEDDTITPKNTRALIEIVSSQQRSASDHAPSRQSRSKLSKNGGRKRTFSKRLTQKQYRKVYSRRLSENPYRKLYSQRRTKIYTKIS